MLGLYRQSLLNILSDVQDAYNKKNLDMNKSKVAMHEKLLKS